MTAVLRVSARRNPRRNPVGRLGLRLDLHLVSRRVGSAVFGPRPRILRPDVTCPRPSGATRPVERAQSHGSGEGGSDPPEKSYGAPAALPKSPAIGGRSLPHRAVCRPWCLPNPSGRPGRPLPLA